MSNAPDIARRLLVALMMGLAFCAVSEGGAGPREAASEARASLVEGKGRRQAAVSAHVVLAGVRAEKVRA